MKSLLFGLITILALGLSSSVMAQGKKGGGSPDEMAKRQTEQMKKHLTLDDAQTATISEINLKYAKKRTEVRKESSGDRTGMRAAMQKINNERNTEFKEILSEEQYQKFLKKEEEMKQKRGQKKGQGQGARP